MKPGTVYQSGKNYYQVTKDGKGFEQCVPKSNRSLEAEYRGIGSSRLCSGRPQPANNFAEQAIGNFYMPANLVNDNYVTWGHIPPRLQDIATNFIERNPTSTYGDYVIHVNQATANTQEEPVVLNENDFYIRRAQQLIINGNRQNAQVYLPPSVIGTVLSTFGSRSLERIFGNNAFTNVVNTLIPMQQANNVNSGTLQLNTAPNQRITHTVGILQDLANGVSRGSFNPNPNENIPSWFNRVYNHVNESYLNEIIPNRPAGFDNIYRQRVAQMMLRSPRLLPQVRQYLTSIAGNQVVLPNFVVNAGNGSSGDSSIHTGGSFSEGSGGSGGSGGSNFGQFDNDGYFELGSIFSQDSGFGHSFGGSFHHDEL